MTPLRMGLCGVANRQNAAYFGLPVRLLICVFIHPFNILKVLGSSICQTEFYTEAGTDLKKPCSIECKNLINGGALDSIFNRNCKVLCGGCYDYIASLRQSKTTPSAVLAVTFSGGTIRAAPTEPSTASDGLMIGIIVLSVVTGVVVIVAVALGIALKRGAIKRCTRGEEPARGEADRLNDLEQQGQAPNNPEHPGDGNNDIIRHDHNTPNSQNGHTEPAEDSHLPHEAGPSVIPDSQGPQPDTEPPAEDSHLLTPEAGSSVVPDSQGPQQDIEPAEDSHHPTPEAGPSVIPDSGATEGPPIQISNANEGEVLKDDDFEPSREQGL